jgi:hypothetical protein
VLAVPGGNWSMLLERSTAWSLPGVNRRPAVMRQLQRFLLPPFEAAQECRVGTTAAPCDCSTGACD